MRFVIENINKVHRADISLKGLTVIAGVNDSGKSTVGKLLFSTVKALANTDLEKGTLQRELLLKYFSSLRARLPRDRQFLHKVPFSYFGRLISDWQRSGDSTQINNLLQELVVEINQKNDLTPRIKRLILQDIENIRACLKDDNQETALASEIRYFIESEFMNKICSLRTEGSMVEFWMGEPDDMQLSYSIQANSINRESLRLSKGEYLQDATYIESPLYMHLVDALLFSADYRETKERYLFRSMVPIHVKDFAEKLNAMRYLSKENISPIIEKLVSIIGGHFAFDETTRTLSFLKDDVPFSPINIASGIKTFGVIQMLLEMDAINENKILIWDEPENHLHPEWQIKFAEVLVELAKAGIPILISTHSPYFMQGVRYFAVKHDMERFVNYYMADTKEDGLSVFEEVSDDLNRVFVKLAEPLNRIMNVDELRRNK